MVKIYTKKGDQGKSGLFSGEYLGKDHRIFWVIGGVDELNASLGIVRSSLEKHQGQQKILKFTACLEQVQINLFKFGAEIAALPGVNENLNLLTDKNLFELENQIDDWWSELPELKNFILPGGALSGALLHQARTICRRMERNLVALGRLVVIRPELYKYINRLSDWLFTAARYINQELHSPEKKC